MTATYDPTDPKYFDPAAFREELDRVFDLCHGCRLCFNLCPSFPTLFNFIDAKDGDVASLTDGEHRQVVDECYQCKLCYVKCPYVPPHEWELDFPRLMSRVHAVRQKQLVPVKERLTDQFLGRTDALGRVSVVAAPVVNWATGTPGSLARRVMEKTAGLASQRLLPPYAKQRFTTWFKKRRGPAAAPKGGRSVSVFPTCFVEYMEPAVGRAIVEVYEHNGVACSLPEGTKCCGAPWLHSGHVDEFTKAARRNVAALAAEVRAGRDVIVAQPTCAYVVKRDYPIYAKGPDADLVAAHTFDPAEYLMRRQRDAEDPFTLRDEFPGREDGSVPGHRDLPRRLPPAGAERRAAQPGPAQDGRRAVLARAALLGHRRDLGVPGGELRAGPQGGRAARPRDRGGRQRHRVRRLPPGQRVDPAGDRDAAACTPCS